MDGRDPATEKQQAKRRLVADRLEELVETFIVQHVSRLRTAKKMERRLRRDVVGRWGNESIHEIKKRDVIEFVTELMERGPGSARRALKDLKTFFRWCVGRGVIDFSPADGIPNPGNGGVRLQMHLDDLGGFGTEALTRWGLEFKRLSCDVAIVAA